MFPGPSSTPTPHSMSQFTYKSIVGVPVPPADRLFIEDLGQKIKMSYEYDDGMFVTAYVDKPLWEAWTSRQRDTAWRKLARSIQ